LQEQQRVGLGIDLCLNQPVCQSALFGAINDRFAAVPAERNENVPATAASLANAHIEAIVGVRVLLAEDNRINRMFAGEILRQAGLEYQAVENGRQALDAVASGHFDVVLMDCQMPEMDGFNATRRIREMERSGQLPGHLSVIALTANAIKGDRERCNEAGMDDYISKPFESHALLETIRRVLTANREKAAETPIVNPPAAMPQPDAPPPIDSDALLARCMGNMQFAESLLLAFADDLPNHVAQIASSSDAGDGKGMADAAHALKGAASFVAAEAVRALAAAIEAHGKAGSLAEVASLADHLRDEAQRCLRFVPEVRKKMCPS
jgi:Amt family ammonium transporter